MTIESEFHPDIPLVLSVEEFFSLATSHTQRFSRENEEFEVGFHQGLTKDQITELYTSPLSLLLKTNLKVEIGMILFFRSYKDRPATARILSPMIG